MLAGLLLAPAFAQAEQLTASELLLPYFEVGLEDGLTTLFAVSNASEDPASIEITVFTNWGIPVLTVPAELEGGGVLTVNLADWIVAGLPPGLSLPAEELEHLQAALGGTRSPMTDLFYSTEVALDRFVGYLTIRSLGSPRPDSLWGDYFIADPFQNFAQGESLISLDTDCQGPCRRHVLRYLDGGTFDGGTQVMIWTGRGGRPSETGFFREEQRTPAQTGIYNLDGERIDSRSHHFMAVEIVDVADLGLRDPFGWLEIITERKTFISVRYSALDRFSVGLRSFCVKEPPGPSIRIEKSTNGEDADTAPGPEIQPGEPVEWEYEVTNTGDRELINVQVSDDRGVDVSCPKDSLDPGETMICTGDGTAVQGQYRNCGTAIGYDEDDNKVLDVDCSHYFGEPPGGCEQPDPAIRIEKSTNNFDADFAPGPTLLVGDPVTWTYRVENTGGLPLENVRVSDDRGVAVSCPGSRLDPGESMVCTGSGTAIAGPYENIGTVTADSVSQCPEIPSARVEDDDPSHYTGGDEPCLANPLIDIEKSTNGHQADAAPGPTLLVGDPISWTYRVENTGNVALENVSVSDNRGVAVSCPASSLAPGASMTCTGSGFAEPGQYQNIGTVTATSTATQACPAQDVADHDPSHYWGETPDPQCGKCDGKVTQLTLRYLGFVTDAYVEVVQKKDGAKVYEGIVQPGDTFSFVGQDDKGTLTTEISIFVNSSLNTKIHTSCSQPIGPGLVKGDFEVVAGASRNGGPLCPPGDDGDSDSGSDSDSDSGSDSGDSDSGDSDSGDSDSGDSDSGSDSGDSDSGSDGGDSDSGSDDGDSDSGSDDGDSDSGSDDGDSDSGSDDGDSDSGSDDGDSDSGSDDGDSDSG